MYNPFLWYSFPSVVLIYLIHTVNQNRSGAGVYNWPIFWLVFYTGADAVWYIFMHKIMKTTLIFIYNSSWLKLPYSTYYWVYPFKRIVKQFRSLTASVLFVYFFYKGICCGYPFKLRRLVDAIQMSTYNVCFHNENPKQKHKTSH